MKYHYDCRHFTGYKPCKFNRPCTGCPDFNPAEQRICIISLEAMGAVLRSTCLLKPLRRKYPRSHITWITYRNAKPLLENNHEIDRLLTLSGETSTLLGHLQFDLLFCVDKSLEAGALAESIKSKVKYGFGLTPQGVIRPLNRAAEYQYDVGLDDHLKFHVNTKPETQQITESMELPWERDEYILDLTSAERQEVQKRRTQLLVQGQVKGVIGFNTGCSVLFPYKKFTVARCVEVVRMWRDHFPDFSVALLGGKEDRERQAEIKLAFTQDPCVLNTPTDEGLRSGILWMAGTDLVFSGCSLGMHIGIALKKPIIAWFGVSCIQEVDLFARGEKIQADVSCSPCWKKSCTQEIKCYDQVSPDAIKAATKRTIALVKPFHESINHGS